MDLTVGLVSQGSIYDEVLMEMLDHQGVSYRLLGQDAGSRRYPLVLMSKYSEEQYSLARKSCNSESDVVVVDKVVSLDAVVRLLSGAPAEGRDNFGLEVNAEEEKLLSTIRTHFFGLSLPLVRKWYWPDSADACCVLTHDVDWFEYSPFHKQVIAQSADPLRLLRLAFDSLVMRRDFGWNIPETVALEQEYGYRSTFFFRTSYDGRDLLEESVDIVREASFEVGLHGAAGSHASLESLKNEIESLRKRTGVDPAGLRYHILKFDPPGSWEREVAAGLKYDATFYFNRIFGFRAGICFPYHPFSSKRLQLLELPTGYMDWTSLHAKQSERELLDTMARTRDLVEARHGVFVANFHNTYLNARTFPGVYASFRSLLATAREKKYWVATARECAEWWEARSSSLLNPRFDSGEVLCEDSGFGVVVERENSQARVVAASKARSSKG